MSESLTLDDYLPFRLAVANEAVCSRMPPHFAEFRNLAPADIWVVLTLRTHGPLAQGAIVELTRLGKVKVSRSAQLLAKQRLVRRSPHDTDARSHYLSLTPEGELLGNELGGRACEFQDLVLKALSPEETDVFCELLRRLELSAEQARIGGGAAKRRFLPAGSERAQPLRI